MNKDIEQFSYSAISIIIYDIMKINIIIPKIVFDYSINPNINNGYYMYQNTSGNIITLNMNSIILLKEFNDIKTVIVYGFIHEIIHMYQPISSKYKTDKQFYTIIEDSADALTVNYIRNNMDLINTKLKFEFNDIFLKGIEKQLNYSLISVSHMNDINLDNHMYNAKTIAGSLCSKLNLNFDYLYNLLTNANSVFIIFPDKRRYLIDMNYATINELDLLINLIYLTDIRMIHTYFNEFIDGYREAVLTFTLY